MKDLAEFKTLRSTHSNIAFLHAVTAVELRGSVVDNQELDAKINRSAQTWIMPIQHTEGQYSLLITVNGQYYYFGGEQFTTQAINVLETIRKQPAAAATPKVETIPCYFQGQESLLAVITRLCNAQNLATELTQIIKAATQNSLEGTSSELTIPQALPHTPFAAQRVPSHTPSGHTHRGAGIIAADWERIGKMHKKFTPQKMPSSFSLDSGRGDSPDTSLLPSSDAKVAEELVFDDSSQCLKFCITSLGLVIKEIHTFFEFHIKEIPNYFSDDSQKSAPAEAVLNSALALLISLEHSTKVILTIESPQCNQESLQSTMLLVATHINVLVALIKPLIPNLTLINATLRESILSGLNSAIVAAQKKLAEAIAAIKGYYELKSSQESLQEIGTTLTALLELTQERSAQDELEDGAAAAPIQRAPVIIPVVSDANADKDSDEIITKLTRKECGIDATIGGANIVIARYKLSEHGFGLLVIYPNQNNGENNSGYAFFIGAHGAPHCLKIIDNLYNSLFSVSFGSPAPIHRAIVINSEETLEELTKLICNRYVTSAEALEDFLAGLTARTILAAPSLDDDALDQTATGNASTLSDNSLLLQTPKSALRSVQRKSQERLHEAKELANLAEELQAKLADTEETIRHLKEQLKIANVSQKVPETDQQEEIATLKIQLAEERTRSQQLKAEAMNKNQACRTLETENETLQSRFNTLEQKFHELQQGAENSTMATGNVSNARAAMNRTANRSVRAAFQFNDQSIMLPHDNTNLALTCHMEMNNTLCSILNALAFVTGMALETQADLSLRTFKKEVHDSITQIEEKTKAITSALHGQEEYSALRQTVLALQNAGVFTQGPNKEKVQAVLHAIDQLASAVNAGKEIDKIMHCLKTNLEQLEPETHISRTLEDITTNLSIFFTYGEKLTSVLQLDKGSRKKLTHPQEAQLLQLKATITSLFTSIISSMATLITHLEELIKSHLIGYIQMSGDARTTLATYISAKVRSCYTEDTAAETTQASKEQPEAVAEETKAAPDDNETKKDEDEDVKMEEIVEAIADIEGALANIKKLDTSPIDSAKLSKTLISTFQSDLEQIGILVTQFKELHDFVTRPAEEKMKRRDTTISCNDHLKRIIDSALINVQDSKDTADIKKSMPQLIITAMYTLELELINKFGYCCQNSEVNQKALKLKTANCSKKVGQIDPNIFLDTILKECLKRFVEGDSLLVSLDSILDKITAANQPGAAASAAGLFAGGRSTPVLAAAAAANGSGRNSPALSHKSVQ